MPSPCQTIIADVLPMSYTGPCKNKLRWRTERLVTKGARQHLNCVSLLPSALLIQVPEYRLHYPVYSAGVLFAVEYGIDRHVEVVKKCLLRWWRLPQFT